MTENKTAERRIREKREWKRGEKERKRERDADDLHRSTAVKLPVAPPVKSTREFIAARGSDCAWKCRVMGGREVIALVLFYGPITGPYLLLTANHRSP